MDDDRRAAAYETLRPEILGLVPARARRILDLGCAAGSLGAALKEARGDVHVTGIELDPGYAARAGEVYDRVVQGDVADVPGDLGRFDCLVAADVLEHLIDPWTVLGEYAAMLQPGCRAIVSLPNVAHWTTYASLARGRWPRLPEGVHDETHLRWFTKTDAIELCEQAGLVVEQVVHRPWLLWRGTKLDRHAGPLSRFAPFTFQHVIAARRMRRP